MKSKSLGDSVTLNRVKEREKKNFVSIFNSDFVFIKKSTVQTDGKFYGLNVSREITHGRMSAPLLGDGTFSPNNRKNGLRGGKKRVGVVRVKEK